MWGNECCRASCKNHFHLANSFADSADVSVSALFKCPISSDSRLYLVTLQVDKVILSEFAEASQISKVQEIFNCFRCFLSKDSPLYLEQPAVMCMWLHLTVAFPRTHIASATLIWVAKQTTNSFAILFVLTGKWTVYNSCCPWIEHKTLLQCKCS